MGVALTVRDQSSVGEVSGTLTLPDVSATTTLRELIRTRVREEVARFNAAPSTVFRGLVMPEGAENTSAGFVLPEPRRVEWERQADEAIESFGHNGFFVLVDGHQVADLDEPLRLSVESDVRFVRLVQLIGG